MKAQSTAKPEQSRHQDSRDRGGQGQGQQAMAVLDSRPEIAQQQSLLSLMAGSPRLQRKCACGAPSAAGGSCAACEGKQNSAKPVVLQKQLAIGAADDPLEREADRVADQVMRMTSHEATPLDLGQTSRPMVSRLGEGAALGSDAPSSVHATLASAGQPLASSARSFVEPRFGVDFSQVRVHTDGLAQQSAREINAHAYTVGSHVVFGAGHYATDTVGGKHLLAHELTHVLQQRGHASEEPAMLWRVPITRDLTSIPQYEWTGTEQRQTRRTREQSYISLSFEPTTNVLTCTFKLRWRFPPAWPEARRVSYINEFANAVTTAWQGRFPLVRYQSGRATTTTASVALAFDSVRALDMGNDTAYINWLLTPAGTATRDRWTMNVHDSFIREEVDVPNVHLDPGSNTPQTADTSADTSMYTNRTYTNSGPGGGIAAPPYQHYFDQGITPSVGSPPRGGYRHVTSAHEFGHMLGLADEYVMPAEDYQRIVTARGQDAANTELRRRRRNSNRIQSVGDSVTRDAYAPFANFLSTLTSEDWRVQ